MDAAFAAMTVKRRTDADLGDGIGVGRATVQTDQLPRRRLRGGLLLATRSTAQIESS